MLPTVCTNNRLDSDLVAGRVRLGTRYSCLQKGIGTALHLPVDLKYLGPYEPIDDRRIYCGNNDVLPDGYDRFGNLPQCLQVGIGLGKRQKALDGVGNNVNVNVNNVNVILTFFTGKIKYILIFILMIIVFISIFFSKPSVVMGINSNKEKIIDWKKFIIFYLIMVIPISYIMFKLIRI